jgi:hypothetical protein
MSENAIVVEVLGHDVARRPAAIQRRVGRAGAATARLANH